MDPHDEMQPSSSYLMAQFVHDLHYGDIPAAVQQKAKQELLDTIGICLASSAMPFSAHFVESFEHEASAGGCVVVGMGRSLPAADAALINGVLAHGLDFDDTHSAAIVHTSASLVPVALAVAEQVGASGIEMLTALVAGYEISTRVGLAASGEFHKRGYHPTSICGVFGAAMVAGKLLRLSKHELANALGIAGSQSSGIQEFLRDGSEVKRLHAGWAALSGMYAATFAQHGVSGPERVFEGQFGLYATHIGQGIAKLDRLTAGLGTQWETLNISLKPYPCCHLVHAYMDAALAIKRKHHLAYSDIAGIECPVPETVANLVCKPEAMKQRPPTTYAALFSLPFCIGLMLSKERATVSDFRSAAITDEEVLALARRVSCPIDREWSRFPEHFSGWVVLRTHDGQVFEAKEPYNRGSPDNPLSDEDITAKFLANAGMRLAHENARRLIALVERLDSDTALGELCDLVRAGSPRA